LKNPLGASKAHEAEFAAGIGTVEPIPNEPKLTAPVAISVSAASMSTWGATGSPESHAARAAMSTSEGK
jgi:hypothetical protein